MNTAIRFGMVYHLTPRKAAQYDKASSHYNDLYLKEMGSLGHAHATQGKGRALDSFWYGATGNSAFLKGKWDPIINNPTDGSINRVIAIVTGKERLAIRKASSDSLESYPGSMNIEVTPKIQAILDKADTQKQARILDVLW